jgi:hypothetical protein
VRAKSAVPVGCYNPVQPGLNLFENTPKPTPSTRRPTSAFPREERFKVSKTEKKAAEVAAVLGPGKYDLSYEWRGKNSDCKKKNCFEVVSRGPFRPSY